MFLEQVFCVTSEDLVHWDNERAGRILLAIRFELGFRARHFNARHLQTFNKVRSLARIVLFSDGDDDRGWIAFPARFDRSSIHLVDLLEQLLAMIGRSFKQCHRRDQLIVDDVAEGPLPSHPRARILSAGSDIARRRQRLVRILHLAALLPLKILVRRGRRAAGLRLSLFNGTRNSRACDFSQQSHLIVPPAAPRHRSLPKVCVSRVVNDPFLACGLQRRRLGLAENSVPTINERMHILIYRIGSRHHEYPRTLAPHLMLVQPHRRKPVVPQHTRGQLTLLLGKHVHIAVVVVADVRMIEPRQRTRFVFGADVLVVPVGNDDLTVRVQTGD